MEAMGYGRDALEFFVSSLLRRLPSDGALLELGAQDINADVPREAINFALRSIHGETEIPPRTLNAFDAKGPWRIGNLFRGSAYRYRCLDLFDGEFHIVADLNTLQVGADRGTFDLITNMGTTEHVADQINCFRAIHDYARVGGTMYHAVPFTGYLNHGLYAYQPLFFIFLAHANNYEIEHIGLSDPHLPYTIPKASYARAEEWSQTPIPSGIIVATLRKTSDMPFKLFTDFDQSALGAQKIAEPWATIIADRSLRVAKD
jgi:hypothetical protein